VDGNDTMIGFLKSTPIEHVEVETPLIVRRHELVPDSFGHGRFRGGAAIRIELECRAPEARITVRGLDRFRFQPWGAFGGTPGSNGRAVLNPDGPEPRELGRIRVLTMRQGDVLRMTSPSGGGFGAPFSRDPAPVLREVEDGLLSSAAAARCYGVAITDGAVDAAATAALRRGAAVGGAAVTHGPERQRYEGIWPAEVSAALAKAVLRQAAGIRTALLAQVRDALRRSASPVTVASAEAAVTERARMLLG
jgi:N-methylhydantoinase B